MTLVIFIFGLIIGSFLNALIWRISVSRSIARGRSECPLCHHVLAPQDLFPVLSFVLLKGRCHYCRGAISWQYPLVECATAILFAGLGMVYGLTVVWGWAALISSLLLVIFVLDARYSIIPDSISIPLILIGLGSIPLLGRDWLDVLLGVAVGGGFFLLQWLVSRGKWVGDGDIRLGAAMGAILGWQLVLVALLLAYISGAVWAIYLLSRGRTAMHSKLPFGMFLAAATLVTLLWGQLMIDWYLSLLYI